MPDPNEKYQRALIEIEEVCMLYDDHPKEDILKIKQIVEKAIESER